MGGKGSAYAAAGVDIDVMMQALRRAGRKIKTTNTQGVVSDVGSFGGLFKSPGRESLLVSSIDGVGTKLNVAHLAGVHNTIGQDLVNHCTNDILTQGATPLFFMDYLGTSQLEASVFSQVVDGLCKACRANGCALIGGETAEMPGLYPPGEYDLVGTIVGAVPRKALIDGGSIRPGDLLIGLPSSGLHTNGYSLARKIVFEQAGLALDDRFPGTRRKVSSVLLDVHRSYLKPITALMKKVKIRGLAHITGGGLTDNLPRILPAGTSVRIERGSWNIPPVFRFLAEAGKVDEEEMYRVFNMGIGMVLAVRPRDAAPTMKALATSRPRLVGAIKKGRGEVEYQ